MRLVCLSDADVAPRELDSASILIGRHKDAEVRVEHPSIHRKHALLASYLGGRTIHDLCSQRGVWVNGERVERAELEAGDEIRVGDVHFTLEGEADLQGNHEEVAERSDEWFAQFLSGDDQPMFATHCRLEFRVQESLYRMVTVGRDTILGHSSRAGLWLPARGVSSLHGLLAADGGAWYLHDLKSSTGITRGGEPLTSASLADGDLLTIGDFSVKVRLGSVPRPSNHGQQNGSSASVDLGTAAQSPKLPSDLVIPAYETGDKVVVDPLAELESSLRAAETALGSGDYEKATAILSDACRQAPFDMRCRKALRFAQQKRTGRAPTDRVPFLDATRAEWASWRARRALEKGDILRALVWAEKGLSHDPWRRTLLLLEGVIFERQHRFDLCIWSLNAARERAPQDVRLNRPMAKILHVVGSHDRSLSYWEMVEKALPGDRDIERQIKSVMVSKTLRNARPIASDSSAGSFDDSSR